MPDITRQEVRANREITLGEHEIRKAVAHYLSRQGTLEYDPLNVSIYVRGNLLHYVEAVARPRLESSS